MTIHIDSEGIGRCDNCGCEGEGIVMHSCFDVFKLRIKELEDALADLHEGAWSPSPQFMRNLGLEPFDFEAAANKGKGIEL